VLVYEQGKNHTKDNQSHGRRRDAAYYTGNTVTDFGGKEQLRHPDGRAFMQNKPGRKNGNREAGVYERKL